MVINAQNWEVDRESASDESTQVASTPEPSVKQPDDIASKQLTLFDL